MAVLMSTYCRLSFLSRIFISSGFSRKTTLDSWSLLHSLSFSSSADKLVVVSYNILGVNNALNHPDLYNKVSAKFLEWDRRKVLIHGEINTYNASILCFQVNYKLLVSDACIYLWRCSHLYDYLWHFRSFQREL